MPTIKISLDSDTYDALSDSAVRELRPIPWQLVVLLRQALGLPFPYLPEREAPCPLGRDTTEGRGNAR